MLGSDRQEWWVIFQWDDKRVRSPVLCSVQEMINLRCLLHLFRLFWWFFWNWYPWTAACCGMKAQVLDLGETTPALSWGIQLGRAGTESPDSGEGGQARRSSCCGHLVCQSLMRWAGTCAGMQAASCTVHSCMRTSCASMLAFTFRKTPMSSSAWWQLGFEEGCLQDTYCLIFTARRRRGLLRAWHMGRFVLVASTLSMALVQLCFASCYGTSQVYPGPWWWWAGGTGSAWMLLSGGRGPW